MKFFLFIAVLWAPLAFADWDPEYCFPDEDVAILDDVVFKNVKQDMIASLRGSWCSEEKINLLMDLVYMTRPGVCVEIGAFTGSTVFPVAAMLKYLQCGTLIAIDAWSNAIAIQNMESDDPNRPWWSQVYMEGIYQQFLVGLAARGVADVCSVFRCTSETAALFIDTIDFLHLDGDYSEKGSLQDVRLYLPKVKPGGYILLSNLFVMVKGKAPKMKAFSTLFDSCEMICEIERDNVVLFRKNE